MVHAGCQVHRNHFDFVTQATGTQDRHRSFGSDRAASDVVDILVGLQHIFDQARLHFLASVAVLGFHQFDGTALECFGKAFIEQLHETGTGWTREPGNANNWATDRMLLGQVKAGAQAFVARTGQHASSDFVGFDAVERVDHGDVPFRQIRYQVGCAFLGNCPEYNGVATTRYAVFNLGYLVVQCGVTACIKHLHSDTQPLGFLNDPIIGRQPERIFHVRK
ncbi:hypothetical protein D3C87_1316880 [compost metagenome]